jgi:hypothetical protein
MTMLDGMFDVGDADEPLRRCLHDAVDAQSRIDGYAARTAGTYRLVFRVE